MFILGMYLICYRANCLRKNPVRCCHHKSWMVWWPAKQTADDEAGHYDLSCQIQCFFWCEVIYQFKFIHGCCLGGGGWVERMNESLKRQSTHILHSPMAVHPKQPNEPFRSGWLVPIMCWSTILWMAHCWQRNIHELSFAFWRSIQMY